MLSGVDGLAEQDERLTTGRVKKGQKIGTFAGKTVGVDIDGRGL